MKTDNLKSGLVILTPEELSQIVKNGIKSGLEDFREFLKTDEPIQLLTREQTCKFLQIDSSTLWAWTNKGKVIAYGIGNRRYYKKAELLQSLQQLKK
jgi:hypothetical protein